ncbi:glycosyltransferase [Methylocystis parvus]|uniref:glycosyltransferase n=1 Tax=Methylocystis parvus TaxID=134 RepID=UPI003C729039
MKVLDVYRYAERDDQEHLSLVLPHEINISRGDVRIFHINGDEVEPVLRHLGAKDFNFGAARNIILPAWELPVYPDVWVPQLKKFDEVWAISKFVQESLAASGVESKFVGQAAEVTPRPYLSRRYFGLRDSAFVVLAMLDFSSFPARKNPRGAIDAFLRFRDKYPYGDAQLALKVKGDNSEELVSLKERLATELPDAVFFSHAMTAHEVESLIATSDCFMSLHRAEGFGRVLAEAMFLGTIAVGTAWSGNLDFMTQANSILVPHEMRDVQDGEYPEWKGQRWADPDLASASEALSRLFNDRVYCRDLAAKAARSVRMTCSNRAVGLRMYEALQ